MTDKRTTVFKSFEQLASDVRGKWSYIYSDLAPELDQAMAVVGARDDEHVPCPVHGGTDGFRLFRDYHDTGGGICNTCGGFRDGFKLLAWLKGYTLKDAVKEVGQWDRKESNGPSVIRERPAPKPFVASDPAAAYRQIRQVWLSSKPIAGTAAAKYLLNRGIWLPNQPTTLRFHPGLRYYCKTEEKVLGTYPCMLAPIKGPDGRLLSIHRTYLTNDGKKAPVPFPKKLMTPVAELPGAAIRLFEAGKVLGVAEGIETALAAHAVSRMPVWSCVNTALLKGLEIPQGVELLVIWEDKDRLPEKGPLPRVPAGQAAADKLQKRAEALGIKVERYAPPLEIAEGARGVDWLDALTTVGLSAFPEHWRRWRADAQAA